MLRITFEDHGQDFLRWYINNHGIVVDSQPYQYGVWAGSLVLNTEIIPGCILEIKTSHKGLDRISTLNYPVEKVEKASWEKD